MARPVNLRDMLNEKRQQAQEERDQAQRAAQKTQTQLNKDLRHGLSDDSKAKAQPRAAMADSDDVKQHRDALAMAGSRGAQSNRRQAEGPRSDSHPRHDNAAHTADYTSVPANPSSTGGRERPSKDSGAISTTPKTLNPKAPIYRPSHENGQPSAQGTRREGGYEALHRTSRATADSARSGEPHPTASDVNSALAALQALLQQHVKMGLPVPPLPFTTSSVVPPPPPATPGPPQPLPFIHGVVHTTHTVLPGAYHGYAQDVGSFVPIVLVPGVANPVNLRNVIEARRVQQQQPPVSHTDIAFGAPKHDARATQNAPPQDEIACDSQGYGKAPRDRRAYDCGEVPGLTIYNKLVRTGSVSKSGHQYPADTSGTSTMTPFHHENAYNDPAIGHVSYTYPIDATHRVHAPTPAKPSAQVPSTPPPATSMRNSNGSHSKARVPTPGRDAPHHAAGRTNAHVPRANTPKNGSHAGADTYNARGSIAVMTPTRADPHAARHKAHSHSNAPTSSPYVKPRVRNDNTACASVGTTTPSSPRSIARMGRMGETHADTDAAMLPGPALLGSSNGANLPRNRSSSLPRGARSDDHAAMLPGPLPPASSSGRSNGGDGSLIKRSSSTTRDGRLPAAPTTTPCNDNNNRDGLTRKTSHAAAAALVTTVPKGVSTTAKGALKQGEPASTVSASKASASTTATAHGTRTGPSHHPLSKGAADKTGTRHANGTTAEETTRRVYNKRNLFELKHQPMSRRGLPPGAEVPHELLQGSGEVYKGTALSADFVRSVVEGCVALRIGTVPDATRLKWLVDTPMQGHELGPCILITFAHANPRFNFNNHIKYILVESFLRWRAREVARIEALRHPNQMARYQYVGAVGSHAGRARSGQGKSQGGKSQGGGTSQGGAQDAKDSSMQGVSTQPMAAAQGGSDDKAMQAVEGAPMQPASNTQPAPGDDQAVSHIKADRGCEESETERGEVVSRMVSAVFGNLAV